MLKAKENNTTHHRYDGKGLSPTMREASIIDAIAELGERSILVDNSQTVPSYIKGFRAGKTAGNADGYHDGLSGAGRAVSDHCGPQNVSHVTKSYEAGYTKGYKFGYDVGVFKGQAAAQKASQSQNKQMH